MSYQYLHCIFFRTKAQKISAWLLLTIKNDAVQYKPYNSILANIE